MTGVAALLATANGSLSAAITPASVSGSGSGVTSTDTATCNATGGAAPYSYAWARVSGDASITANTPTAGATYFSALVSSGVPSKSGVWQCTVTDAAGQTAVASVSVMLNYSGPL